MNLIKDIPIVQNFCSEFLEPHPCEYNFVEILQLAEGNDQVKVQYFDINVKISTKKYSESNTIRLNLINHKNSDKQLCIVYLHGLNSFCLEGKFLSTYVDKNCSLCLFDLRGHGRNKSKLITYGLLEAYELYDILIKLKQIGFQKFVLWGRSMGAVTSLMFIQKYKSTSLVIKDIQLVIVDSPFRSLQTIAIEMLQKMCNIPTFIAQMLISMLFDKIQDKYDLNLELINLECILNKKIPIVVLYSSIDQIIKSSHSKNIYQKYLGQKQLYDTLVNHNELRPLWIIQKLMKKIKRVLQKSKLTQSSFLGVKKRGLSLTRIQLNNQNHQSFQYDKKTSQIEKKVFRNSFNPDLIQQKQSNKSFEHLFAKNKQNCNFRQSTIQAKITRYCKK